MLAILPRVPLHFTLGYYPSPLRGIKTMGLGWISMFLRGGAISGAANPARA